MPRAEERRLQAEAAAKIHDQGRYGSVEQHRNAYVYGTLRKQGWKPQLEQRKKVGKSA